MNFAEICCEPSSPGTPIDFPFSSFTDLTSGRTTKPQNGLMVPSKTMRTGKPRAAETKLEPALSV